MEQYEEALRKLAMEAAEEKAGQQIGTVAEITRRLLAASPAQAEKVLDGNKTCKGAFGAMKAEARKKAGGDCCYYMPPEEAEAIIAAYWGIEPGAATEKAPEPEPKPQTPAGDLLDDLLGGL